MDDDDNRAASRGAAALRAVAGYYCGVSQSRFDVAGQPHAESFQIEDTKIRCLAALARISKELRLEVESLTSLRLGFEETQTTLWLGHRREEYRGLTTLYEMFDVNTTRLDLRPFPGCVAVTPTYLH